MSEGIPAFFVLTGGVNSCIAPDNVGRSVEILEMEDWHLPMHFNGVECGGTMTAPVCTSSQRTLKDSHAPYPIPAISMIQTSMAANSRWAYVSLRWRK